MEFAKEVKGNVYDMVVEGFQLLSRWTARVWEQCAWKFSRPCKEPVSTELHEPSSFSDYEKVLTFLLLSIWKSCIVHSIHKLEIQLYSCTHIIRS